MQELYWKVGGVDLEPYGVQMRGSVWRPPISMRRAQVEIPGMHGQVPAGALPVFEAPTVALHLHHSGVTAAALDAATSALVSALSQPTITLTRSLLVGVSRVDRTARAELVSIDWGDYMLSQWAKSTVVLTIPGVFFRDGNTTPWTYTWGTGALTAQPVTHLAASTGPVTDAIVRVLGPVSDPAITDVVSGTSLSWSGTVPAGTYLYLDARTLTARTSTSSSAWLSGGTNVSSGLNYSTAGPLQLWPRPTAANPAVREVVVSASGTGRTIATTIAIRAEGSYL